MSLPSDVTPDIEESAERMVRPPNSPRRPPLGQKRLTLEQKGWVAAAFVAFLGIVYGGPALARLRAQPGLRDRAGRQADDMRRRFDKARKQTRRRVRRLGGGSIWR